MRLTDFQPVLRGQCAWQNLLTDHEIDRPSIIADEHMLGAVTKESDLGGTMLDHARFPEEGVLHIRRILPATADEVWRYLVEDRLRRTWFCAGNVSDKVGGSIEFEFDDSRLSDSPPPEGVNERDRVAGPSRDLRSAELPGFYLA